MNSIFVLLSTEWSVANQHQKMSKHSRYTLLVGCGGQEMGPDEENMDVCGLGRVLSGDVDAALVAPVHGSAFGNHWPTGESNNRVYLKSHHDPHFVSHTMMGLSTVVQSLNHVQLCDPMNCSRPGFLVLHYLRSWLKLMAIELGMPSNHSEPNFCSVISFPLLFGYLFPSHS